MAGGSLHDETGGGSNYLCLPKDPNFRENIAPATGRAYVYGAEYQNAPIDGVQSDHDVPCAVCQATRRSVLMIPAKTYCHPGWTNEYTGYLAANMYKHQRTEFVCMDGEAEPIAKPVNTDENGALFYPAVAKCVDLQCPPYIHDGELLCAVCTR